MTLNCKNAVVVLMVLLSFQVLKAQTNETNEKSLIENTDCSAKFEKVKELYAKMFKSPSSVNYRKLKNDFFNKIPKGFKLYDPEASSCEDKILFWVRDNIDKTDFKSFEEAKQAWEKKNEARALSSKENSELYDYLEEIKKSCGGDSQELFMDLIEEYGNEFYL